MSTLKVDTINTTDGSGNITFSRPTVLQAGDIVEADLADNAVTLAKMAGGTDGQIITYDASGDPVSVGPGTDGQVLTSTGAGSPPAFEAAAGGGAWTFISSTTVSNDASVTLTGLSSSSYKTYVLVINNLTVATDNYAGTIRYGDSGGIDSGASDYTRFAETCLTSSASFSAAIDASVSEIRMGGNAGNAAGEGFSGTVYLSIGDGSVFPSVYGHYCSSGHLGTQYGATFHGARLSAITTTQVQVITEGGGGNLIAGTIDLYGISQS